MSDRIIESPAGTANVNKDGEQLYPLVYQIVPPPHEPWPRSKIIAAGEGWGGADAILIHSILYPEDGGRSELILGMDGRTGKDLPDIELFKSMVGLAYQLKDSTTLGPGQRRFCKEIFERVRQAILAGQRLAGDGASG